MLKIHVCFSLMTNLFQKKKDYILKMDVHNCNMLLMFLYYSVWILGEKQVLGSVVVESVVVF